MAALEARLTSMLTLEEKESAPLGEERERKRDKNKVERERN